MTGKNVATHARYFNQQAGSYRHELKTFLVRLELVKESNNESKQL